MKKLFLFIVGLWTWHTHCPAQLAQFHPGEVWNDTENAPINAHGGCVVFHNGTYYWFGEDRTKFESNGVSCYSSTDLYNWKRIGLALKTDGQPREDLNDISQGRLFERPKVIYNPKTQKWVMWSHWEKSSSDYGAARVCESPVLTRSTRRSDRTETNRATKHYSWTATEKLTISVPPK